MSQIHLLQKTIQKFIFKLFLAFGTLLAMGKLRAKRLKLENSNYLDLLKLLNSLKHATLAFMLNFILLS
jgi:hypothetical protein